ncbi:MAG: sulfurtransferase [Anaerolineales bacterium]
MLIQTISTKELSGRLNNPQFTILDIRSSTAYHGWRLQDEARGGHIPGAICFSQSWIKDLSPSELRSLLESKDIKPTNAVVVYGYQSDDCLTFAKMLKDIGFSNVLIYQAGIQEWAADVSLPMDKLKNVEKLVYPEWIKQLISGKMPPNEPQKAYGLFEIGWEGLEQYVAGHIPGAVYFELSQIEDPHTWNIIPNGDLSAFLLHLGITSNDTAVLYGRNPMASFRAANILMYAGVEDVRVLDGGFDAWLNAGYPVETGIIHPTPQTNFGRTIPAHPEYVIGIDQVKELLAEDDGVLVNVRSWDEYLGKTIGYSFIETKGHIAGAVWGYSGSDPHHMQDYKNPDNTMRSYHEIVHNWKKQGITPDKRTAFYCGTGWRASEAFFYAYLIGWPEISVYDGGWFEWSQDPSNPIELGSPFTTEDPPTSR